MIIRLPQIRKEMKNRVKETDYLRDWNTYLALTMFWEANKERCKTAFNDNSQELETVLAVIHNKNMEENL